MDIYRMPNRKNFDVYSLVNKRKDAALEACKKSQIEREKIEYMTAGRLVG